MGRSEGEGVLVAGEDFGAATESGLCQLCDFFEGLRDGLPEPAVTLAVVGAAASAGEFLAGYDA